MSTSVTWSGSSYTIPAVGDASWGNTVSSYLIALASSSPTGALARTGGAFTLTNDVLFGGTYGLQAVYYKSNSASIAASGVLRLAKGDIVAWRNNAGTADLALGVNVSDQFTFGSSLVLVPSNGLGTVTNADVSSAAAIAYSKLNLATSIVNADVSATAAIAYSKLNLAGAVKLASDVTGLLPAANGGTGVLSTATFPTSGVVVTEAGTETLTNKTLTAPVISSIVNTGTLTLPTATTTLVGTDVTQTLSNKTVLAGTSFKLVDPTDQTKVAEFDVSGIGTGTTNTYILPNVTGNTVVLNAATQTLINKDLGSTTNTLTGARASYLSPDGTHTVSFPGSTDTLVGRTTTDTLTNKTLTAPAFGSYTDWTEQGSAPVTPSAGALRVYSKTDHRLYTKDSSGVETAVGSGSGTGQKNYITNPSAASTTTGWSLKASSTGTLARDTSSSLPRLQTTGSGFKYTSSATDAADYIYTRFTLDDADKARKLGAWLSQNTTSTNFQIQVWKNSASDYSGTYTQFTLPTDVSSVSALPAADTDYKTSFDTDTTVWLELRIKHAAASAEVLYFSDTIVGPGVSVQGAAVTGSISYTPTFGGMGTVTSPGITYQRVGDSIHVQGRFTTGTVAASTAAVSLPNSYTANVSNTMVVGSWWINDSTANDVKRGTLNIGPSGTSVNFGYDDRAGSNSPAQTFAASSIIASTEVVWVDFWVSCNELVGSGTVNIAGNDVEYAYNTSTNNASDTTSFGYGPSGVQFGSYATASVAKRVRFQTPIQSTDRLELEIYDTSDWMPIGGSLAVPLSATTGMALQPVSGSTTDVDVWFGSAGYGATPRSSASAWSAIAGSSTFLWRVRKVKAGAAVGFGIVQPGVSAGLVSASGVPAFQDNSSAAASYVAEEITSGVTSGPLNTSTYASVATITITPGTWEVSFIASNGGTASLTGVTLGISTASGTSNTGFVLGKNEWTGAASATFGFTASIPPYRVTVASGSTQQLWLNGITSGAGCTATGVLRAVRPR